MLRYADLNKYIVEFFDSFLGYSLQIQIALSTKSRRR